MALRAPKQEKNFTPQENLEPGSYPARVVRVYGAGTHPQVYMGEAKKPAFVLYVVYELVDAFMVDDNGNELEDKPRWIMESFPLHSLESENAKSTKRYLAIDPTKKHEGDWSKLIGEAVSVTVVNNAKDGKVYDNIGNTSAIRARDALKMPDLINEGFFFDPSEPNIEYFNKIPKFIQDKIKTSLDFAGSDLEKLISGAPAQKKEAPKKEEPEKDEEQDQDSDQNPWD